MRTLCMETEQRANLSTCRRASVVVVPKTQLVTLKSFVRNVVSQLNQTEGRTAPELGKGMLRSLVT